jgi:hypothetical protein
LSKKRPGAKAGDPEGRPRFVALYNAEVDSMAFKTLSPAAVWLLVQIRRAWRGSNDKIVLPFSAVKWRLAYGTFDKARRELVEAGFIRIMDPGGLSPGGLNPTVYALVDGWREASKRLLDNLEALYEVKVPLKTGGFMSVWYPKRPMSESQENLKKAAAAIAKKRTAAALQKKAKRIPKMKSKRIPKSPDREMRAAAVSVRRRLQNSITLLEREGHG